jgi:cytochrome c oxidase assembly protein subunit 15
MEWGHRLWGRAIGLSFVLPALYFWHRGWLSRTLGKRVLGISALIGFQVSNTIIELLLLLLLLLISI